MANFDHFNVSTIHIYTYSTIAAHLRPRSKTFEEYEKDTDDVWDDNEEDMSTPAELEFPPPDDGRGEGGGVVNTKKQAGLNGKGISELVRVFPLIEVLLVVPDQVCYMYTVSLSLFFSLPLPPSLPLSLSLSLSLSL